MKHKYILSTLIILMMVATAVADLGFMHAGNEAWPPHARFHAVWNVTHVWLTHGLALLVLWSQLLSPKIGFRISLGIYLAFPVSFFVSSAIASFFGASVHPDLPLADQPPRLLGMDVNTIGFLVALPFALWAWRISEKDADDI